MIARAKAIATHNKIKPGSAAYKRILKQLDIPSYLPAIAAWLATFDMPQIGITPRASATPDPRYKDRLPAVGSVFILTWAPHIRDRLIEVGEGPIHISEACDLMEQYMYLGLAHFTINQPGAEAKAYRARQSITGKRKRGKEGALKRAVRTLGDNDLAGLLEKLGDEDAVEDLYGSRSLDSRIDVHDFEVSFTEGKTKDAEQNRLQGYVTYTDRSLGPKKVSFGRLRNILNEVLPPGGRTASAKPAKQLT